LEKQNNQHRLMTKKRTQTMPTTSATEKFRETDEINGQKIISLTKTRFDELSRQPLLLIFAMYQVIVGVALSISPMWFLEVTSFYGKYSRITSYSGPWPHFAGFAFLIQGIPYVVTYLLKYDMMYKPIILSRLLSFAFYATSVFVLGDASFTLVMTLGAFEIIWLFLAIFLVLNKDSMKTIPPKISYSNIREPSFFFTLISVTLSLFEALACLFAPNFWCSLLEQRSPPQVQLYIRWYGFMQLLTVFFVYGMARNKRCHMVLYAHELFGRLVWALLTVWIMWERILIPSVPLSLFITFNNLMTLWAFFELRKNMSKPGFVTSYTD
jgi:hypothetical protein